MPPLLPHALMAGPSRKLKSRWLLLAVVVVLLLAIAPKVQQYYAVVAVQASLKRNWEIHWAGFEVVDDRPACLPKAVDESARRFFNWMDDTGQQSILMHDRFRALFRAPITDIDIYEPTELSGDLGAALHRFPKLQRMSLCGNGDSFPMEADYRLLCTRLRELPRLEELALDGGQLTTVSLAPLAGHPTLQKLTLPYSRITPDITQVLATIPNLKEVEIGEVWDESKSWESLVLQAKIRAALPGVTVTFIK